MLNIDGSGGSVTYGLLIAESAGGTPAKRAVFKLERVHPGTCAL